MRFFKTGNGPPLGEARVIYRLAAAVVVAAAAVAAAAEEDEQDDDPQTVVAAEAIVVIHKITSGNWISERLHRSFHVIPGAGFGDRQGGCNCCAGGLYYR